ncbi:branched-chain amino acid transport system II carrier protein [Paeniclostridium hominis]|uniref:branched-chain amino acid transport system II carrier protein n=1 Tax=Paeniclostridium hominis TaxID=2764329 RepID=UPI0022E6746F|nr:branched-chain amino acid transport system II carrier protein [Paeniclostridium hominis]
MISLLRFILSNIRIILLYIIAVAKAGSLQNVIGRDSNKFGIVLEVLMMLCLSPILVIPRTGAITFEMSILPLFNNINSYIFSTIFFALTLILTIKSIKFMDIICKFLTPVLLSALLFLIIKSILYPIVDLNKVKSNDLFITGVTQ